jgi:transposase-like protein
MIFPITDLLDKRESMAWGEKYFPPHGLRCPRCAARRDQAREFRRRKGGFVAYRCHKGQRTYTLSTGALFAGSNVEPRWVVLVGRGVGQGEPATL